MLTEQKLNGGETLVYISEYFNRLPYIFRYEVLPNPTEQRAKILDGKEVVINRYGYKRDGAIYFQEVSKDKRTFRLMDKEVEDLIAKIKNFDKIQKAFEGREMFSMLSLEQMQRIADIIDEKAIHTTEKNVV